MKDHCVLQRVAFSLNFWFITSDMTMQWEKQKQLRFCWNVSKDIRSCVKLEIKTRIDQISCCVIAFKKVLNIVMELLGLLKAMRMYVYVNDCTVST